jgi:hypothetical protein
VLSVVRNIEAEALTSSGFWSMQGRDWKQNSQTSEQDCTDHSAAAMGQVKFKVI